MDASSLIKKFDLWRNPVMSLRINQNVMALRTYGSVSEASSRLGQSIEKLSSGLRIVGAADDAAGLAISEKMRRQIRGLSRAVSNAQDGISMIQTAEGALNESQSILQRMRELAVQSSNDTLTSNDRLEIQKEVDQLKEELNRIANGTEFNTRKLLNGNQTALMSASTNSIRGFAVGDIEGGGTYDVDISLLRGGVSEMQRSQIFTINDSSGSLADGTTQLQSIAQFYDADGVFVLNTPQTITLHGNAKTTQLNLDGQMTLDNLAASIQNAIVSESGLSVQNTRVATINTVQSQLAGVGGYLEVTSGSIGSAGAVSFSADQKVLDALGMSTTRNSVENWVEITIRDGFGNVKQLATESDRASGLLQGIDMQFSSQAAQIAGTQGLEMGLLVSGSGSMQIEAGGETITVDVKQGYWTMEGISRSLNKQFEDANVDGLKAGVVEGQIRLSYEKPVSAAASIPNTISLSSIGDGAQIIGFVEGTYAGFVDAQKDDSMARLGFSTYVDIDASETAGSIVFSVGDGTANGFDVSVGLTDDVEEADMQLFVEFQSRVNQEAKTNSVAVRVDQVGGAMVFTSLRVGTEHFNNQASIDSIVSLNIRSGSSADDTSILQLRQRLGFEEGLTARGRGDKNFKFHVVDNRAQLQTGADQGQTMQFAIAEMSAEALGVDRIDLTTASAASDAMGVLNKAIDTVSAERAKLGALQNRIEFSVNNLRNTHSNLTASESRIRDADIAMEMIEFIRNQIISQSGTAMLAQANMATQGVLQLLG